MNNEFLDWNTGFTAQESQYILLDEGVYRFKVSNMEKKVYQGNSSKIPNGCPFAFVTLEVQSPKGLATVTDRLYLLKSMQWKLTEFFAGIGQQVVNGQPFNPNWNAVVGATGKAAIGQHPYVNRNGEDRKSNQVERYLKPTDNTPAVNDNMQQQASQQPQQNQQNQQPQQPQQQMPFNNNGTAGQPGAF